MSFDAGSVVGGLKFDFSEYTHGMLEANGLMNLFGQNIATLMEEPLLGLAEIAKETGKAIFEMINGLSESQHKVSQTAEALGVSIEFLDGWGKAAQLTGLNATTLAEAMSHLSRASYEALHDKTGTAAKAFSELGIHVADASGKLRPMEALMREVADAFSKMDAGANRNALAMSILSRAGDDLLPFFAKGSKAADEFTETLRKQGNLTTKATAESARAWIELETNIGFAMDGIKAQIAQPIRDALTPILKDVSDWFATHPKEIESSISSLVHVVAPALQRIGEGFKYVLDNLHEFKTGMELAWKSISIPMGGGLANAFSSRIIAPAMNSFHASEVRQAGAAEARIELKINDERSHGLPDQAAKAVKEALLKIERQNGNSAFAAVLRQNAKGH